MKNDAKFWDNIAEKYAKSPVSDVESWDATLAQSREHLSPSDEVLEIGAGTGSTAFRMHDGVKNYRATDISSEMIQIAKGKLDQNPAENLSFDVASIFDEPEAQYDAVLAYNLLHLVDSVPETVKAVHSALKNGGVFISKSGCISGKYRALSVPIWVMQRFGKAPYLNSFSLEKLTQDIQDAGFEIISAKKLPEGSMNGFIIARKI